MRVLFLSYWYPFPATNGSKLRIYNLLRGLAREHSVTLLTFTDALIAETPRELSEICERVVTFPRPNFQPGSLRALLGLLNSSPRSLAATHDPRFAAAVQQEIERGTIDLIIASEWGMAPYGMIAHDVPAILEDPELGLFVSTMQQSTTPIHRARHLLTLFKLRRYAQRALRGFAACTVVSEGEAALLRRCAPGYDQIYVLPNCVDLARYEHVQETPEPDTLIYSGALSYTANYDAVIWLIQEILPLVRARRPNVRLVITGDPGGRSLPPTPLVTQTGFLDDVRPVIAESWVSLVPLRTGGGTRLKILEAMALRTPVVATSKGAEGIDATPGRHLLIADTPADFASAVVRLLDDPTLRQSITDEAYALVRSRYDWSVTLSSFLDLVRQVAHRKVGGRT